jgi:sugar lactone lactonase YvrE
MPRSIQCVASPGDVCGEGAIWHPQANAVFWTDINRGLLHRYNLGDGTVASWSFDQPVTALTLTSRAELILVVLGGRILLWEIHSCRTERVLHELPEWPKVRCNDARVDPNGNLWFGTMQNNVAPDGSATPITEHVGQLLRMDNTGSVQTWHSGLGIANTMAWSVAGDRMYFADTLANRIYVCGFDLATSTLTSCGIFNQGFPRGLPDGSSVDAEGHLWNCRYGGGCIVRFAPDGSIAEVTDTPCINPTTCAFVDVERSLYFTSASDAPSSGQPNGALYSLHVETPGLPATPFRLETNR